jgi:hypothetical protein
LQWEAPPGCSSHTDVLARVEAKREARPWAPTRVNVIVTNDAQSPRVHVHVVSPLGERDFVAPSCDDAANAVALLVAIAATSAAAPPPPEPPARIAPQAPQQARRSAPPAPPLPVELHVWTGPAVDSGSLPHTTVGLVAGVHAQRGWFGIGLEGAAFLPQTERASSEVKVQLDVSLFDVLASLCVGPESGWGARSASLGVCAKAGVGLLHGRTTGISSPGSGNGPRAESALSGRLLWPLSSRVALRFEAGPLVDWATSPFRVSGLGDVYRPAALSFRGASAIEFRIR